MTLVATLLVLSGALGCQGLIYPGGEGADPDGDGPAPPPGFTPGEGVSFPAFPEEGDPNELDHDRLFTCTEQDRGGSVARMRRLSQQEYFETYFDSGRGRRALAGRAPLAVAAGDAPFTTYASLGAVDEPTYQALLPVATSYARLQVDRFRGDDGWAQDREQVERFFSEELRRANRRPFEPAQLTALMQAYDEHSADLGAEGAVLLGAEAIHLSPASLYRLELGRGPVDPQGRRALDAHELREAISYLAGYEPADDAVRDAVEDGSIAEAATLRSLTDGLLGEPLGESGRVRQFFNEWLRFPQARDVFKDPSHTDRARERWEMEGREGEHRTDRTVEPTAQWLRAVLDEDTDVLEQLLIGRLGEPDARAGILTEPSWLITYSHAEENDPIRRGLFITEELLCNALPEIPLGVVDMIPTDRSIPLRERLGVHSSDPSCAGCHRFLDGIGLAFERYDDFGIYRDTEAGQPVDTTAELLGSDVDGAVSGPLELSQRLAASTRVRQCMVRQAFRFWMGRNENYRDACALSAMDQAYLDNGGSVRALLLALVESDSFRYVYPDAESAGITEAP